MAKQNAGKILEAKIATVVALNLILHDSNLETIQAQLHHIANGQKDYFDHELAVIELGMDGIEVFASQAVDKSRLQDKVRERWDRICAAAMKQCKRPWAPDIAWSGELNTLLQKASNYPNKIFLDPHGEQSLAQWRPGLSGATLALIGSEKGLEIHEIELLRSHGFTGCRIEGAILRATTAAIATAALLRQIVPQKS